MSLDVDGVQKFVKLVDEKRDLSFAVDGDVRLDACIPSCLDASPDRLLEPSIWKASTSCRNS